jgi:N utilization substance protein B
MPTGRRSARRQAVFLLYQQDLLELTSEDALARVDSGTVDDYTARLVRGVGEHRAQVDDTLELHLQDWSVQRLGVLERAILRVATYELLWEPEVPPAVVIDEAVESAKRFCSDEAGSLVNGVLGGLAASARVQEAQA